MASFSMRNEIRASMEQLDLIGAGAVGGDSPDISASKHQFLKQLTESGDHESFRCEDGSTTDASMDRSALMGNIVLEEPEAETRWYFKYFLGNVHSNYVTFLTSAREREGKEREARELVLLSLLRAEDTPPEMGGERITRAILWRRTGSEHLILKANVDMDIKTLFLEFGRGVPDKKIEELTDPDVQQLLLVLEEQEGAVTFKMGILYATRGQKTDDDMFSNEHGSESFDRFVDLMGTRIELKGFQGYRGGLDVKTGSTGTHSAHTVEFGKEIMYHVSTLLPYSKENPQQLERKRHLGNDICNIVFQDDHETEFHPELIKSKFNHVFAVVSLLPSGAYRLKVFTKNSVPMFGPPLPSPPDFIDPRELRHFLIVKLLNAEKAALSSPISPFAQKRMRTLETLIHNIYTTYATSGGSSSPKMVRVARGATTTKRHSKHLPDEMADFRAKGQEIKVNKIVSGAAPTSTLSGIKATEGESPWLPVCITTQFPHTVICGDQWDADIVVCTDAGVFKVTVAAHEPGQLESVLLIDDSVIVKQIRVDEDSGLMVLLTCKSVADALEDVAGKKDRKTKDTNLYVLPLDMLTGGKVITKKQIKPFVVPNAKGVHMFDFNLQAQYSTAALLRQSCKLAVAIHKKIRTYQFVARNPGNVPGQGSGGKFVEIAEFTCADSIETLTVANGGPASAGYICAGVGCGEFQLIDLGTGAVRVLLNSHGSEGKIDPVTCDTVPSTAGDALEYYLCYNQVTVFRSLRGEETRAYDVSWHSRPHGIAYAHPYLLGFTHNSIQVVTLLNGKLVKTMTMPNVLKLTSKRDVFFATRTVEGERPVNSLYRISRESLSGKSSQSDVLSRLPRHVQGSAYGRKLSSALVTADTDMLREKVRSTLSIAESEENLTEYP